MGVFGVFQLRGAGLAARQPRAGGGGMSVQSRLPAVYYFLYFASIANITPYLNVVFRRAGLTEAQVGILGAIRPWISAPASFGWAALADKLSIHRTVYLLLFTASTLMRSVVALPMESDPFPEIMAIMLVTEVLSAPCSVLADAAVVASLPDRQEYGKLRAWGAVGWGMFALIGGSAIARWGVIVAWELYWMGSFLTLLASAFFVPFKALGEKAGSGEEQAAPPDDGLQADEEAIASKEVEEHKLLKGRDPGAAAAGEGGIMVELVEMPAESLDSELSREFSLPITAAYDTEDLRDDDSGLDLSHNPPSLLLEEQKPLYEDYEEANPPSGSPRAPPAGFRSLLMLLLSPSVTLFLMLVLVMGTAVGVIDNYLFMYLEELGATETLMGLTLTFTCIGTNRTLRNALAASSGAEVPVLFFSGFILRALGTDGTLNLVVAALLLRLAAYSSLSAWPSPWLVLPVELLHGITFGCAWSAGTHKCSELAPEGLGATMQGLFQGTYFGVGKGLGTLVGGLIYNSLGAAMMYRCAVAWVVIGWVLQAVLGKAFAKRQQVENGAFK